MSAKVVVDVNVWLSFCIGQLLDDLPDLVALPNVELFTCIDTLLLELGQHSRTKIIKYRDFRARFLT